MKKLLSILLTFIVFTSCSNSRNEKVENLEKTEFQEVKDDDYELLIPKKADLKGTLMLFGGYPEMAEDIKREFNIAESAYKNGIAVIFMNYNRKLWIENDEKKILAEKIQKIFRENKLLKTKIYFGGFSSGGNVALLIGDYLTRQNSEVKPKGIFIIDSPVDLAALYQSSQKNIERNFSEPSVQESYWIMETLGNRFGSPYEDISDYENYSIYTSETENFNNINHLKNVKLRFYSEPDTAWWRENRKADFDQMNAFYLERLSKLLKKSGFKHVEYIPTENRGYRANGEKHPHSWSIVDNKELIKWLLE